MHDPRDHSERTTALVSFLTMLFGRAAEGWLLIWTIRPPMSHWFPWNRLADAASLAIKLSQRSEVYFGVGLRSDQLGKSVRGTDADVVALPCLWVDIDVRGPAHKATNLPPSVDDAMLLLADFALPPSVVIDSGHGVHAYWILRDAWVLKSEDDRRHAKDASRRLQGELRRIAGLHGWTLDGTHDLSRVLRLPGTWNRKPGLKPVPVRLIDADPDRRYGLSELQQAISTSSTLARPALNLAALPAADLRSNRLDGHLERLIREGPGTDSDRYQSRSEALWAVICKLVLAGYDDAAIAGIVMDPANRIGDKARERGRMWLDGEITRAREKANKPSESRPRPTIFTAKDLASRVFPPQRWIVPGMMPADGTTILAAKPKTGKSLLALSLAVSVAGGARVFGSITTSKGPVLYLGLEDGERRIKERMEAIVGDGQVPDALDFSTSWPTVSKGAVEELKTWILGHPGARLIIVDTLKKIRPPEKVGASVYSQDYDSLAPLTELAHQYSVAVLIVHHTRKAKADDPMDLISGSLGLSGAVDAVWVLERERQSGRGTLHVIGRDVEEGEISLAWDPPNWTVVNHADHLSPERQEIIAVLRTLGPATPKEVHTALLDANSTKSYSTVKSLLWKMSSAGEVRAEEGGRYLALTPINCVDSVNLVDSVDSSTLDEMVDAPPSELTSITASTELTGFTARSDRRDKAGKFQPIRIEPSITRRPRRNTGRRRSGS